MTQLEEQTPKREEVRSRVEGPDVELFQDRAESRAKKGKNEDTNNTHNKEELSLEMVNVKTSNN